MSQSVAKEIVRQIRTIDRNAMMAWGAKNLIDTGAGLRFKTSGMVRWKGIVSVIYDYAQDLYTVEFGRVRKLDYNVVKRVEGVYAEDLVNIIDEQVG